jgi:hypothetical protein
MAASRAAAIEQKLREALCNTEDPASLEMVTVTATIVLPEDTVPEGQVASDIVSAALDTRILEVVQTSPRKARLPFQKAGYLFEPVLTCQRGEVVGHYVESIASQARQYDDGLRLPPGELHAQLLASIEQLIAGEDHDNPSDLLFLTLDVEHLLRRATLDRYLNLFRNASSTVRTQLVILLSRWPSGIPSGRIRDLVGCLQPVCRTLGFHLDELAMPKLDLSLFANPYIAVDANQVGASCVTNGRLERFVLQLHARRARVLIREVSSMQTVRQLQSLGVDLVSLQTRVAVANLKQERLPVMAE